MRALDHSISLQHGRYKVHMNSSPISAKPEARICAGKAVSRLVQVKPRYEPLLTCLKLSRLGQSCEYSAYLGLGSGSLVFSLDARMRAHGCT